jgi:hypothetical protein
MYFFVNHSTEEGVLYSTTAACFATMNVGEVTQIRHRTLPHSVACRFQAGGSSLGRSAVLTEIYTRVQ